jgi:broad specificity phosphatase PhoE
VRLAVLARHAHSLLNEERRVNGDPARRVPLTELGRAEARLLGLQLSALELDLCVHTRFGRTRETAELALAGRNVPFREEPLLDDVNVGELEGSAIDDYRTWKHAHTRADAFPGGESLDDAARRYAQGFRNLLAGEWRCVLVICHEIPIRYALNASRDSADLDGPVHDIPNAAPFLFDGHALARAAERIANLAQSQRP